MNDFAPLIDYLTLVSKLWALDLPEVPAYLEMDPTVGDTLPYIRYSIVGDGQTANGPGAFNALLTWNVVGTASSAWAAMAASYAAIHGWATSAPIDGVGHVQKVTDTSLPAAVPSPDVSVKSNTQFAATVALVLRN